MKFSPLERSILYGYAGSTAHGLRCEDSDYDFIGTCVPTKQYFFGLDSFEHSELDSDGQDSKIYDIRKYFRMLLGCNPNVYPYLFIADNLWIKKDSLGQLILDHRMDFASAKACSAFLGYGEGELRRVDKCNGKMGSKRKSYWEKYGYDTRSAANCIRILRMGIHFMRTGDMMIDRSVIDRDELLAIKQGSMSLDDVLTMGNSLLEEGKEAKAHTLLPAEPNYDIANALLIHIVEERLKQD